MVLLDAVFILEYLLRNKDIEKYENDPALSKKKHWIQWDLILLENQLPFCILEKLYLHLVEDGEGNYTSLRDLACDFFNRFIKSQYKPSDKQPILHFTDLVRSLLSVGHPKLTTREPIEKFHSATKLHEASIKCKGLRNEGLLDVKFTCTGKLRMPCLEINYYTELIFGNLMALEHCHYQGKEYICHYVKLLNTLIATPKDVRLLVRSKIIMTKKDWAEVVKLITKLSAGTSEDHSCYHPLYEQLDQHCQKYSSENSWRYLKDTYFGNIWKGTATISASLLLLLAFVQAIVAILALKSQGNQVNPGHQVNPNPW